MELALSALSTLGFGGLALFFIQRYFNRRDKREAERAAAMVERMKRLDAALETIRLLSYARLSEETERLLTQGFRHASRAAHTKRNVQKLQRPRLERRHGRKNEKSLCSSH